MNLRACCRLLVALSVLAFPVLHGFAQAPQTPPAPAGFGAKQGRIGVAGGDDAELCRGASGGSRTKGNCEPVVMTTPLQAKQEFKVSVQPNAPTTAPQCEVTVLTEYTQRNTVARINGSLVVKNCSAGSTGTYSVSLRVKDASDEIKPLEFSEQWKSTEASDVRFTADYPIGSNVELVNARVRNVRCTCAGAAQPPTQTSVAASGN